MVLNCRSGQALDSEMSLGHFYIRLAITVKTLDSAMSLGSYFVNIYFQDDLKFHEFYGIIC